MYSIIDTILIIVVAITFVYIDVVRVLYSRGKKQKFSKMGMKFGHGSPNYIVEPIVFGFLWILRLAIIATSTSYIIDTKFMIAILIMSMMLIWIFFWNYKKNEIYENGVSSAYGTWTWKEIKSYERHFGIFNDFVGIKIIVDKNILTSILGEYILNCNENEVANIEMYFKEYGLEENT